MGELVCGAIAPHGFSIVGEIAGEEFESFKPTRDAMENLGEMIVRHRPDTIIILTPHGLRLKGYNAIYTTEYCRGTFIPLWFCKREDYNPEIVVIGPTRDIPLDKLVRLGEIIGHVCKNSNKKVALIASADQGHCHDPKGPYGYHEASRKYDEEILSIIKNNELHKLLDMDMNFVEDAKPDSLWQMLILYGASKVSPMVGELLSYDAPTYFGMAVASYEPK